VPVGFPPGMLTSNRWLIGLPPRSPRYRGLRPVPLSDSQNAPPLGLSEMPHGLIRFGSRISATPGWSDTRFLCWSSPVVDSMQRPSRASSVFRDRVGLRAAAPLRRPPSRESFELNRRLNMLLDLV